MASRMFSRLHPPGHVFDFTVRDHVREPHKPPTPPVSLARPQLPRRPRSPSRRRCFPKGTWHCSAARHCQVLGAKAEEASSDEHELEELEDDEWRIATGKHGRHAVPDLDPALKMASAIDQMPPGATDLFGDLDLLPAPSQQGARSLQRRL